jgi:hypothetical protein
MKAQVVRLVSLLLLTCSPLLIQCGGTTNNPTETATETGNPPAVVQQKLSIVANGTDVELRGDAGAVTAGAMVTLTNQTTSERGEGTAQGDGSVSVVVAGSLQDQYEVRVSTATGEQTFQVFSGENGAVVESEALSCVELTQKLGARMNQARTGASRMCSNDEDCTFVSASLRCTPDCGNQYDSVALTAAAGLNAEIRNVENAFCDDFQGRDCFVLGVTCNVPAGADAPTRPGCVAGQCAILRE